MSDQPSSKGELAPHSFTKRVPATSVAPTYKLTLPADVVLGSLEHLVGATFELVELSSGRLWPVSIVPRKNKDKYEYTLQGWRTVAEDCGIKTGDQLDFAAQDMNRLHLSIRKGVLLSDQQSNGTLGSSKPYATRAVSVSSSDDKLLRKGLQAVRYSDQDRTDDSMMHSITRTPDPSPSLPRATNEFPYTMQLPFPGPDAPVLSTQAFPPVTCKMEVCTPTRPVSIVGPLRIQQSMSHSSGDQASMEPTLTDVPAWQPLDNMREDTPPKRRCVGAYMDLETRHSYHAPHAPNLVPTRPPLRPTKTVDGLDFRHPRTPINIAQEHPSVILRKLQSIAAMSDEEGMGSTHTNGESSEVATKLLELGELRQSLHIAQHRAARAEAEVGTLMQSVSQVEEVLEQQTAKGLAAVSALCHVATQMSGPNGLPATSFGSSQQLRMLQQQLQIHSDTALDALWRLRNLAHPEDPHSIRQPPATTLSRYGGSAHGR